MSIKIQNKRSAVLNKVPTAADLDYGEIGINYNSGSPAIYIKDSTNTIRKIGVNLGGLKFRGPKAPTDAAPGTPDIGDVYVINAAGTLAASWIGVAGRVVALHENIAWDGTEWVSLGSSAPVVDASTTVKGIIQLATAAEVLAGTDALKAVTPKEAKDHYLAKNIALLSALP